MQFQQRQKLWVMGLSAVTILLAFWMFNPFNLYFLNDDFIHIPLSKDGVLFQRNSLRPLGDLSVQMDYFFWEKNASGYHITNLLLHVVNTVLVFFLTVELQKKYRNKSDPYWPGVMTAVLFFVYAFHSETIFWILGRSASLGTLFFIPALFFYLRRFDRNYFFILSMFFFTCGLFAYESTWIFPFVMLVIAVMDNRIFKTSLKEDIIRFAICAVVFSLYLVLRYNIIREVAGNYEASAFMNADIKSLSANFIRLFARCFLPPSHNYIYFILSVFILFIFLFGSLVFLHRSKKSIPFTWLSLTCLIICFLPYLSLGISTRNVEGERYLYMPSIFSSMLLVAIVNSLVKNKNYRIVLWVLLLSYNLSFLYKSKTNYTTAGSISKTTFHQINLLSGKSRLFIDSLPQTVNGALVFRLGFDEGLQWLKEVNSVDTIFILSVKQDNTNWTPDYHIEKIKLVEEFTVEKILVRDSTHIKTYIEREVGPLKFNPLTDARFVFENDRLKIIE